MNMKRKLNITIEPKIYNKLTKIAEEEQRSLSNTIEIIITERYKKINKTATAASDNKQRFPIPDDI